MNKGSEYLADPHFDCLESVGRLLDVIRVNLVQTNLLALNTASAAISLATITNANVFGVTEYLARMLQLNARHPSS